MTTNEAAERLRRVKGGLLVTRTAPGAGGEYVKVPDWALDLINAAERRATVERIRSWIETEPGSYPNRGGDYVWRRRIRAILDEEAAR